PRSGGGPRARGGLDGRVTRDASASTLELSSQVAPDARNLHGPGTGPGPVRDRSRTGPAALRSRSGRGHATVRRAKMSDPRAIFEQTSKTTGHPNEFRFE